MQQVAASQYTLAGRIFQNHRAETFRLVLELLSEE